MTYNLGWLQGVGSEGSNFKQRPKIHFQAGLSAVAKIISENNIDICAVQEIDFNSEKSHGINQYSILRQKTKMRAEKVVCWDIGYLPFPYTNPWGRVLSGGAVFSKNEIKNKEVKLFDAPESMFFLKRKFYLKRYIQVVSLNLNGKEEKIFNLHLEAFDFETKKEQLKELGKLIEQHRPMAIMGDFNTLPMGSNLKVDLDYSKDPAVKYLYYLMKDYQDIFGLEEHTFPEWQPNCRLDYIWIRKNAHAVKINLDYYFNPSDHKPLALELSI